MNNDYSVIGQIETNKMNPKKQFEIVASYILAGADRKREDKMKSQEETRAELCKEEAL